MDDIRQKLFPVFLKEAGQNLRKLQGFLACDASHKCCAEELETAFRAAHTLKGTALLVQAGSVHKISRRLEALLEKHFSAETLPTLVECEAMRLAVDWLVLLISDLREDSEEPTQLVNEALQALDLAERFPGKTPLVELIDSHWQKRSPQLDDPFCADPELDIHADEILRAEQDPFADDPGFGLEVDLNSWSENHAKAQADRLTSVVDPFADDPDFETELMLAEQELPEAADSTVILSQTSTILPPDLFADDPEFEASLATELSPDDLISGRSDEDLEGSGGLETGSSVVAESEIGRAAQIAESLLLPKEEDGPRREYVCGSFAIDGRDYYLPIEQMFEIAELTQLFPLPLSPPMVVGLVNLRGQVIPVIDLSILNQHQRTEVCKQHRLVVAECQGEFLAFLAEGIPLLAEEFVGEKIDMPRFLSLYRVRGSKI